MFVRELKMNGFLEKAGRSSELLSKQERERERERKSSCGERAVFNFEAKLEQQGNCQQGFSMTLLPTGGATYLLTTTHYKSLLKKKSKWLSVVTHFGPH